MLPHACHHSVPGKALTQFVLSGEGFVAMMTFLADREVDVPGASSTHDEGRDLVLVEVLAHYVLARQIDVLVPRRTFNTNEENSYNR